MSGCPKNSAQIADDTAGSPWARNGSNEAMKGITNLMAVLLQEHRLMHKEEMAGRRQDERMK